MVDRRPSVARERLKRRAIRTQLDEPAVTRLTVDGRESVPLDGTDRVIDCRFDAETDTWEVLLLLDPSEERTEE